MEESDLKSENSNHDLLSILNVVVDHVMVSPTPLEPDEFRWQLQKLRRKGKRIEWQKIRTDQEIERSATFVRTSYTATMNSTGPRMGDEDDKNDDDADYDEGDDREKIKVPVIRMFGPIAKPSIEKQLTFTDEHSTPSDQPKNQLAYQQSGCLHIHGAYPYLLARPVHAGNDALPNYTFSEKISTNYSVNWDDLKSVQSIVDEMCVYLEDALKGYHINTEIRNPSSMKRAYDGERVHRHQDKKSDRVRMGSKRYIRQITVKMGRGFYTFCTGSPAPFLRIEYYDPKTRWMIKSILEQGIDVPNRFYCSHQNNHYEYAVTKKYDHDESFKLSNTENTDSKRLKFRCYEAHIPYMMQFFKDYNIAGLSPVLIRDGRFRTPLPKTARARVMDKNKENEEEQRDHDKESDQFFLQTNVPLPLVWRTGLEIVRGDDLLDEIQGTFIEDEFWIRKETSCEIELDTTVSNINNVNKVMRELPDDKSARELGIYWRAVPSLREVWEEEKRRMALLSKCETGNRTSSDSRSYDFCSSYRDTTAPGAKLAVQGAQHLFDSSPDVYNAYRRAMGEILLRHSTWIAEEDVLVQRMCNHNKLLQDQACEDTLAIKALQALPAQFSSSVYSNTAEKNSQSNWALSKSTSSASSVIEEIAGVYVTRLSPIIDLDKIADDIKFGESVDRCDFISAFTSQGNAKKSYLNPASLTFYDDNSEASNDSEDEEALEHSLDILASQPLENVMDQAEAHSQLDDSYAIRLDQSPRHPSADEYQSGNDCDDDSESSLLSNSMALNCQTSEVKLASMVKPDTCKDLTPSVYGWVIQPQAKPPTRKELVHLRTNPQTALVSSYFFHRDSKCHERGDLRRCILALPCNKSVYLEPTYRLPSSRTVRSWCRKRYHDSKGKRNRSEGIQLSRDRLEMGSNRSLDHDSCLNPVCSIEEVELDCTKNAFPETQSQDMFLSLSPRQTNSTQKNDVGITISTKVPEKEEAFEHIMSKVTQFTSQSWVSDDKSSKDPKATSKEIDMKDSAIGVRARTSGLTIMSIEIHVQCRIGKSSINSSKPISLKPDASRDPISSIAYVYANDPINGENIEILERGCIIVPPEKEASDEGNNAKPNESNYVTTLSSRIGKTLDISSQIHFEIIPNEHQLLLRFASLVQWKDPDILISWDTQGAGIGYIIDRGENIGSASTIDSRMSKIDMVRLLGRTPRLRVHDESEKISLDDRRFISAQNETTTKRHQWDGSGLGVDWDDRVGAGAAASSIVGRITLSGWKIMSEEVQHPNSSYQQAIVYAVIRKRMPFHDDILLTRWYAANGGLDRHLVLRYRISQCVATVLLFDNLDIFGRAGEAARLSGVEFSQSFPGIRGSQYKVEGVLLRALQSLSNKERGSKRGKQSTDMKTSDNTTSQSNSTFTTSQSQSPWKLRRSTGDAKGGHESPSDSAFFFFSPSREDCRIQEALECQAMTLEPKSGFHFDPVVVVDFQSLYPSLIIAYNLCYSTCAGKLEYHSTRQEMNVEGRTTMRVGPFFYSERRSASVIKHHIKSLTFASKNFGGTDRAYVLPTGSIFVSESILKGVLPQVLDELLMTRAMLKKVAKEYKTFRNVSPAVLRQLDARQLALKYVANVTYGYTSATFSGRCAMPVLADAIVECGRRTLINAINLAHEWGRDQQGLWTGCEVIYGDTDSIFIKLPGRSVQQAFVFGEEFCKAVTDRNPPPIHLKLEKVYSATLLQTKKKYCGLKYDSADQRKPIFEAKGMETVRRDQCQLTQKILRNALITLFRERNTADVRMYLCRQWALIQAGRLPVSDFILTGRVRNQYRSGDIGPVQSALVKRLSEADPGRSILHKERVPYVIAALPGRTFKLRDCVLTPSELLENWDSFTIHSGYYITKHVNAALRRCFSLAPYFCDINSWYDAAPKPMKRIHYWPISRTGARSMISNFFGSDQCTLCRRKCTSEGGERAIVCANCKGDVSATSFILLQTLNQVQQRSDQLARICQRCNGCPENSDTFAAEKLISIAQLTKASGTHLRAVSHGKQKLISDGITVPMSICTCTDCEITYFRHEHKEKEIELKELLRNLQLQG